MAFSADELRVLRRALAAALQPSSTPPTPEDVQDCLRLAEAVDEASREGGRLRTFLFAELARYRAALPGGAAGYLERLRGALDTGYVPGPADLAALRTLRAEPCGAAEQRRRTGMLRRCEHLAELDVRARLEARIPAPAGPLRSHLRALPGGRAADPAKPRPEPKRKVPTPGEIWPRRRPGETPPAPPRPPKPPPEEEQREERRATG
jgi:hypothetical protein